MLQGTGQDPHFIAAKSVIGDFEDLNHQAMLRHRLCLGFPNFLEGSADDRARFSQPWSESPIRHSRGTLCRLRRIRHHASKMSPTNEFHKPDFASTTSAVEGVGTHAHLRRYLLLSLLVTVSVTTVLTIWAETVNSKELLEKGKEVSEASARFLWDQLREHWFGAEASKNYPWSVTEAESPLDYVISRFKGDNNVAIVNLILSDGEILYSSRREWMGLRQKVTPEWSKVLSGVTATTYLPSGSPFNLGGKTEAPMRETYVLVGTLAKPGAPEGSPESRAVIELYEPAQRYVADVRRARFWVVLVASLSFAAMFLTHLWLFIKGQRTIVARTKDLEKLSMSLEGEVRARTLELATSRRLADVGRLAAGVAHEVNTPIASIATCADGLLRRIEDPETRRYLEIVRKEAFRVKTITRTLLDFSRAKPEGEDPARRRRVSLRTVLDEVLDLLSFTLNDRNIRVDVSAVDPETVVHAEPSAIHQIVLNLMTNSMDALPNGGTIRWEAEVRDDQTVRLRCHDDGVGIATDLLHQVMDPFVTTKNAGQGTGLGLSLAWTLARRQGGTLTIDSPGSNQGATATLFLPTA